MIPKFYLIFTILFFFTGFTFSNSEIFLPVPNHDFESSRNIPQPDYSQSVNWAAIPETKNLSDTVPLGVELPKDAPKAQVFFIHPTGYFNVNEWNAPMELDSITEENTKFMMANQASVFNSCCDIWAPRYRQANAAVFVIDNEEIMKKALNFAYQDVERAFDEFLMRRDPSLPFIIASHSQGTNHATSLLKNRIAGTALKNQMVAAYIIGGRTRLSDIYDMDDIDVCETAHDLHCVIHWRTYGEGAKLEDWVDDDSPLICINPLSWSNDTKFVDSKKHLGSVLLSGFFQISFNDENATGLTFSQQPAPIPNLTWAECRDGVLIVKDLLESQMESALGPMQKALGPEASKNYHLLDYPLFHMNIRKNSVTRVASWHSSNKVLKNIEKDLIKWDSIKLHRTGTDGDNETTLWLAEEIKKSNLVAQVDLFNFIKRTPGKSYVTNGVNTAYGLPLFDGGSTTKYGVKGLNGSLNDTNIIAITKFGSTKSNEHTIKLNKARQKNEHLAIVAITDVDQNKPGLAVLNAESYRNPFGPPVLQVASNEADWLLNLSKDEKLTFFAEFNDQQSTASNIQTKVIGRDSSLEPIVIMTPKSGWWTSTSERGGGITIWLNAIRHFSENPPLRTIIFTANTGHELSHLGLDHFLENNSSLVQDAYIWFHLGANFAAKDGSVLLQASTQDYMNLIMKEFKHENIEETQSWPISKRPLGEARNIYDGGGEYISLLGSNPLFHNPDDFWPHSIDIEKLEKLNNAMLRIINDIANS